MTTASNSELAAVAVLDNVLPTDLIAWLNRYGESDTNLRGQVEDMQSNMAYAAQVRRSDIAWLGPAENKALLDVLSAFVRRVNGETFGLDLVGFSEQLQVATYKSTEQGFFDWHVDIGTHERANRKLSLVAPLIDPASYEGGEFQIMFGPQPVTIPMPPGRIIAFPSYVLHRVTPVTRGVRRSLVAWISGPRFR